MQKFLFVIAATLLFILPGNRLAVAGPALLLDADSGRVIYAEDQDHPWHPASTTKLMTSYLVFEALRKGKLKLTDAVLQSETSIKEPPSKIGIAVGLGMTVELGLQSLIIKSANDVAVMFAEKIDGSVEKFSARMNRKARSLGMTSTHYVNPNGLHDVRQVTTARDLARLSIALWRDFPEHRERFGRASMNIGKRVLRSYNSMLRTYEGADGMKTGFVCASGYNIVASATKNGRRLIAIVLGARNMGKRAIRTRALLDYGFDFYDWKKLLDKGNQKLLVGKMPYGDHRAAEPANLRPVVCRPRPKARRRALKRRTKKKRRKSRKRRR